MTVRRRKKPRRPEVPRPRLSAVLAEKPEKKPEPPLKRPTIGDILVTKGAR